MNLLKMILLLFIYNIYLYLLNYIKKKNDQLKLI